MVSKVLLLRCDLTAIPPIIIYLRSVDPDKVIPNKIETFSHKYLRRKKYLEEV
jgi:hypothetical protein